MAKKTQHFRLSDEHIAVLQQYMTAHSLANMTEALEQILSGVQSSFLSPSDASGASDPFIDQPACNQRRTIEGVPNCIIPATLNRGPKTIEIPSPLVCEVCQSIRRNLPAETLQTQTSAAVEVAPATTPGESLARNQDPSNSTRKNAGMVYCRDGGLWVWPEIKCQKCKTQTYPAWYDCQIQNLKAKGAEVQGHVLPQ